MISPLDASTPAGLSTLAYELDTLLRKWVGFQPMSWAFLIACTANFGIVTLKNTLAPEFLRLMICESIVGSVTSWLCLSTISFEAAAPRPSSMPLT